MRPIDPNLLKQFHVTRLVAVMLLIVAPVAYAGVAYALGYDQTAIEGQHDLLFYILLIIAVVQPFFIPWLERVQLKQVENREQTSRQLGSLYFIGFIFKASIIEAIYLYGLVVYLVTQSGIERLFAFYPIGIIWTFFYWPTEERLRTFLEKAGRYDGQ